MKGITQMSLLLLFQPMLASNCAVSIVGIVLKLFIWNNVINEDNSNIGVLKDMIDIRGFKYCHVLGTDQVEQIIDEMCVQ